MKTLNLLLACGLLCMTVAASAATQSAKPDKGPAPTASHYSAAQIADRNIKARGGLEAWRAVQTLTLSGKLEAGGKANTELPFVMEMKRPRKSRVEVRFRDQTAFQVFNGEQGWKVRPFLNRSEVEPFTPAEAKMAANWEELDGPLIDYASKGTRISLQGIEPVEGRDAYKLKLTLKDGTERNLWIDAKTFLEAKIDGDPRKMDGKLHKVAILYRDFRSENGLSIPHVLETVVEGVRQSHKMTIDEVAVNRPLADSVFEKPQLNVVASGP